MNTPSDTPQPGRSPKPRRKAALRPGPPRRRALETRLAPRVRVNLYAARKQLAAETRQACQLQIPFTVYTQDPAFARDFPELAFDTQFLADWEPGLASGPTSARFAVVDYDADTGQLAAPAEWNEALQQFTVGGRLLDLSQSGTPQFHQVNVWALLQRALAFFEEGNGLGRRVPWAFEGNRLIVVPHAGYGENAFYDRTSKSLQFYYFGTAPNRVDTCLSADIVHHEFGHAVLDGLRPLFNESASVQTAAFHEFMGDLTAILLALRHNAFRRFLAARTGGRMEKADNLASLAEEFGKAVSDKPYLRTALNQDTLGELRHESSPHRLSQVLTGTMFEILMEVARGYQPAEDGSLEAPPLPQPASATGTAAPPTQDSSPDSPADVPPEPAPAPESTPRQAFWYAATRLQRMAIQALDLLPPVEVTFRDYALAVCRAEQLADPLDPRGYHALLVKAFARRGILSATDARRLRQPGYLNDRLRLSVSHSIDDISRSRAAAYRFLDDNREDLLIPANRDFVVADLYDANKLGRQGARLPRQIILEYVWREEVLLEGPRFGRFAGQVTSLLCGGTLVFDSVGNVLSWACKPGSFPFGGQRPRTGAVQNRWDAAQREGAARRKQLLDDLAAQIAAGQVGHLVGTAQGLLGTRVPPITADTDTPDGTVRFRLSPHLHLSTDHQLSEETGGRRWELSC